MGTDKGKARKSASQKKETERKLTKSLINRESPLKPINDFEKGGVDYSGHVQETLGKASRFYVNQLKNRPEVRNAEMSGKLAGQFASKAVKRTIDDVQGIAKTLLKGFGN